MIIKLASGKEIVIADVTKDPKAAAIEWLRDRARRQAVPGSPPDGSPCAGGTKGVRDMGWARTEEDAERRYTSGYCEGHNDKAENRPYDEQGASSDDWLAGYWAGYKGRPNKYAANGPYKMARG